MENITVWKAVLFSSRQDIRLAERRIRHSNVAVFILVRCWGGIACPRKINAGPSCIREWTREMSVCLAKLKFGAGTACFPARHVDADISRHATWITQGTNLWSSTMMENTDARDVLTWRSFTAIWQIAKKIIDTEYRNHVLREAIVFMGTLYFLITKNVSQERWMIRCFDHPCHFSLAVFTMAIATSLCSLLIYENLQEFTLRHFASSALNENAVFRERELKLPRELFFSPPVRIKSDVKRIQRSLENTASLRDGASSVSIHPFERHRSQTHPSKVS